MVNFFVGFLDSSSCLFMCVSVCNCVCVCARTYVFSKHVIMLLKCAFYFKGDFRIQVPPSEDMRSK